MKTGECRYQPKGRMCSSCQHKHRDCSHLPFNEMPVIEKYIQTGVMVVKCVDFTKDTKYVSDH